MPFIERNEGGKSGLIFWFPGLTEKTGNLGEENNSDNVFHLN
jgi:hypothetical protein